jgi:benzoyl-CoA reductase/2-hydroxyglutaryl-CoA dehydratase subunit BcrC/BadD/HgdB
MSQMKENQNRISTIVRSCKLISRMYKADPEIPRSYVLYLQMLADYYSRIIKSKEEKGFIAAHTIFFPVEILYAMDITPMHTELTAWMTALFTGSCEDLLARSSATGLAAEICSPYRLLAGAMSSNALPSPDVILWTNLICDNAVKGGDIITHKTGCPGFFLDCPFNRSTIENDYLKQELLDLIAFLEKQSGHKMDWNKLNDIISEMNRQIELFHEINELRKNVPSPFPPQDFLKLFTVDCLLAGQPRVTEYLELVLQELIEQRDKLGSGASKERFRVMNIGMPPILLLGTIEKLFRENGAVSVSDPFFAQWGKEQLDPRRPLDSILTKINLNPVMSMYGPMDDRVVKTVIDSAIEYKVDGAIYYAHIGCRQSSALIKLIKDKLNEKGVPVLILDSDIIDVTITPESELQKKFRQFFELLEDGR